MSLQDLPDNHRRSIAAILRLMEDRLEEVARWLTEAPRESGTALLEDDLDAAAKAKALRRIGQALSRVAGAYGALGLPKEARSLRRWCLGTLGLTWELPPDLRPGRMKGYGEVPDLLKPELDALAETLEASILAIESAFVEEAP